MSWSDGASIASIIIAIFAMWQAYESSKRAEILNKETRDALNEIHSCVETIKTLVGDQQNKQIDIISKNQENMTNLMWKMIDKGEYKQ